MKTSYRITLASLAGFIVAGIYSWGQLNDQTGILFLPFTMYYGFVLAVLLICLEELLLGKPKSKKIAAAVLLIWIIWAVATHFNHNVGSNKDHPHFCNGVPVEQYQGTLPENCRY